MLDWLREHLWWTFTYFVRPEPGSWSRRHPLLRGALWAGRNLLGAVLVVAGIAMLILPGQGILTILIGLIVLEFPGKRDLELRLVRRPRVRRAIDWLRAKGKRPPLVLPD
ncbi:MAG: PGPGW domain-containing protein [Planctomycetota bacterium]|jgi:UPF0716 family protein affecting phage T7 exclusion